MLGCKLFELSASLSIIGLCLRRFIGIARIERYRLEIDGGNIIGIFIFAAALMGDSASGLLTDPLLWLGLLADGCLAVVMYFCLSVLVFWRIGCEAALAVGLMTAQRNVGLMLAAAGGSLSDVTWLYFALSQLLVYLSPHLLVPLIEHLRGLRTKS